MKGISLLIAALLCSFFVNAQSVLTEFGLFDDFSSSKNYVSNATNGRSLIWTTDNNEERTLTRDSANKRLLVRTTQEKENYHSFGVSFGYDSEGKPYTIDLSANGKFSFDIANMGIEGLAVRISCVDIYDRQIDCSAGAVWVNPWYYQWQILVAPGSSVTFEDGTANDAGGKLKNICNFATGLWGDYVNKVMRNDCDLRHIKSIEITVINSAINGSDYHAYPLTNGLLSISNFSVGDTTSSATSNPKYIAISAPSVVMTNDGGSVKSISVESNIQWAATVATNQTWLSVSPVSGNSSSDSLTFTAEPNPLSTMRTATVTISADGAASKTITVMQLGQAPTIVVLNSTEFFSTKANSTISAVVHSNVAWTAKADTDQNWLSVSSDNGASGSSSLKFIAQENTSILPRTAKVTFSGTDALPKVITLTQAGVNPALSVSKDSTTIASEANSTTTVDITSNITWKATSTESWLQIGTSIGTAGLSSLTLTANINPTTAPRTATVKLSVLGATVKLITVTQAASPAILQVLATTATLNSSIGSADTVSIFSTIPWTASANELWVQLNNTSNTGNSKLIISALNQTDTTRSATITISASGMQSQNIVVTQDQNSMTDIVPLSSIDASNFIYPNPASETFTIITKPGTLVRIYSEIGKEVFSVIATTESTVINCDSWSKGVYVAKLNNKKRITIMKFVIK
jgi:hypothetical protein